MKLLILLVSILVIGCESERVAPNKRSSGTGSKETNTTANRSSGAANNSQTGGSQKTNASDGSGSSTRTSLPATVRLEGIWITDCTSSASGHMRYIFDVTDTILTKATLSYQDSECSEEKSMIRSQYALISDPHVDGTVHLDLTHSGDFITYYDDRYIERINGMSLSGANCNQNDWIAGEVKEVPGCFGLPEGLQTYTRVRIDQDRLYVATASGKFDGTVKSRRHNNIDNKLVYARTSDGETSTP